LTSSMVLNELALSPLSLAAAAKSLWLLLDIRISSPVGSENSPEAVCLSRNYIDELKQRAVVAQIGLQPDCLAFRLLEIRASPTVVAYWQGEERARAVGIRDSEVGEWLDSIKAQDTPDIGLRHSSAKIFLDDNQYADATKGYVWLWNNSAVVDPSWMGVRISFMVQEIESLAHAYQPAHSAFRAIRDATGRAAAICDAHGSLGPRVDWIALNQALGDQDRTIEWFDMARTTPSGCAAIEHAAIYLVEPLKLRQRWSDIGRLFPDPVDRLKRTHDALGLSLFLGSVLGTERTRTVREVALAQLRSQAVILYAGLLAAGRTTLAKAVVREALRLDPSEAMRVALDGAPIPCN
jgi:hypothetical protein